MRSIRFRALLLCVLLFSFILIACQHHEAPKRSPEPYISSDGAVGFDILPLGNTDGTRRWVATYTSGSSSTRFRIEITPNKTDQGDAEPSSGAGKLLVEPGSDPIPMLEALKKALQAKSMPKAVKTSEELPFSYVSIGENLKQMPDGGFTNAPKGNWTLLKITLGKDNGVLLNFDTFDHQAEFAVKDPARGDAALAELAKVL